MSKATVELDLFRMEKDINTPKSSFRRQRSLRDIQGAISKINPQVLKSLITGANNLPKAPEEAQKLPLDPSLPFLSPLFRHNVGASPETAPLTIFYNGAVAVFDVTKDKAGIVLKFAEEGISKAVDWADPTVAVDCQHSLGTLNGDLPIARRKSLQRFLEKRKERLISVSPLACTPNIRY